MALAIPTPPDGSSVLLRFGGVEVDPARHRLTVDGREVRVQRLVFNLVLALCEAQGRVLSRDELFAKLWPDGSFPADESLSQLVFKLRGALGPYGGAVVTVRQVGVRLDAEVEQVPGSGPGNADVLVGKNSGANEDVPGSAGTPGSADVLVGKSFAADEDVGDPGSAGIHPTADEDVGAPRNGAPTRARGLGMVLAALAALLLVAVMIATRLSTPVVVSAGFGLDSDDVQASDARTIETLQRAFEADAEGNQAAARVLMETAHAADLSTPVPSMFLTYWYGGVGDAAAAERWAAERDRRLGSHTPTYLALLARFLSARDAPTIDRLKLESLLLETEPGAALIRLSRAHHHLQRNERALALEHLRQVDLRAVGRRRAPIVLGDLAALGDGKAVEAALETFSPRSESGGDALDAPGRAYAQARLRVTQGRWAEARTDFDRAMALTKSEERPDIARGSALHAAMMSAELGEFADARQRLEQAIQALRDERANAHAWHSTLVLATLPNVAAAEARDLLQRLADEVPQGARSELCLDVELVSALLRLYAPPALRCAAGRADAYARRGGSALTEGLRAQLAGDPTAARIALARAESDGVRDTVLAPYADLLIARLNGTVQVASVPDPPYPAWHRWALRWREAPLGAPASPPARR